jgi:hypothetical protein
MSYWWNLERRIARLEDSWQLAHRNMISVIEDGKKCIVYGNYLESQPMYLRFDETIDSVNVSPSAQTMVVVTTSSILVYSFQLGEYQLMSQFNSDAVIQSVEFYGEKKIKMKTQTGVWLTLLPDVNCTWKLTDSITPTAESSV